MAGDMLGFEVYIQLSKSTYKYNTRFNEKMALMTTRHIISSYLRLTVI